MLTFHEKLKELREKKGKTQGDVAGVLDVSVKQIQRYEKNIIPKPDKIKVLNRYFNHDFFMYIKETIPAGEYLVDQDTPVDYRDKYITEMEENKYLRKTYLELQQKCSYLEHQVEVNLERIEKNQQLIRAWQYGALRWLADFLTASGSAEGKQVDAELQRINKYASEFQEEVLK
jgi:transcriptional regulator with XRE-family HTH domain